MSYDISLEIDTGNSELQEVVEIGNYTYNCSGMFVRANSKRLSLRELHGMTCTKAEPILAEVVENMQKNPAEYKAMNPENGWGSYDTFLPYLENFLKQCRANPKCKIGVY